MPSARALKLGLEFAVPLPLPPEEAAHDATDDENHEQRASARQCRDERNRRAPRLLQRHLQRRGRLVPPIAVALARIGNCAVAPLEILPLVQPAPRSLARLAIARAWVAAAVVPA